MTTLSGSAFYYATPEERVALRKQLDKEEVERNKKREIKSTYNTRKAILQLIARKDAVLSRLMLYFDEKDGARHAFECHRMCKHTRDNFWYDKEGKKKYARLVEYSGLLKT
jgi:hypothetical protein